MTDNPKHELPNKLCKHFEEIGKYAINLYEHNKDYYNENGLSITGQFRGRDQTTYEARFIIREQSK